MTRLAALLSVTALASGAGVLLAGPADAASISGTPGYDGPAKVIFATIDRSAIEAITVSVSGPSGYAYGVESGGLGNPTRLNLKAPNALRNGAYTLTVTSNQAGTITRTVNAAAPPSAPSASASSSSIGEATVSWTPSPEVDVTGYSVVQDGSIVRTTGRCSGCSATITWLTPGTDHSFSVVAFRSCPTCAGGSTSASSDQAGVTVLGPTQTSPPSTDPSTPPDPGATGQPTAGTTGAPGATPGAGTSGTPGPGATPTGTSSPGATAGPSGGPSASASSSSGVVNTTPRRGVASFGGFSGFGTALSVPGLTLGDAAPTIAGSSKAPTTPDGTFDPQLAYDDRETDSEISASGDGSALPGPLGDAVDSAQLMRTLAAALILLLAGAHLRRWLSDSARPGL